MTISSLSRQVSAAPHRLSTALATHPLAAFVCTILLLRVLTDDLSSADSRHSGSLNFSGGIAILIIVVALGLIARRHQGMRAAIIVAAWLCAWTAVAVNTNGVSTETAREGVREGSIIALGFIIYNARDSITAPIAGRLVQFAGVIPALLALFQLATHTGMNIDGNIRSNGTFAHPNSAAVFFAVAATISVWRYLDTGHRWPDALLALIFAVALLSTYSIDGLGTLIAMLVVLSALHIGSFREKLVPAVIAAAVLLAFFATPLGAQRIAKESTTNVASAEREEANSTLAWRLYKWKTLLAVWERAPVFGQGLGTTVTEEGISGNEFAGDLPHNEYIRYLVETGVVGLALLLGALAALMRTLIRGQRLGRLSRLGTSNVPGLALAIMVGILINAIADNTILYSAACYAAVLIVAVALSLANIEAATDSRVRVRSGVT
jgi:O-antigen ligase